MFRSSRWWTVPSWRCTAQANPAVVRARPATAERRSPSDCQRLPVPHYIKEAAAAAQEAGTRRPARIPPLYNARPHHRRAAGPGDSSAAL